MAAPWLMWGSSQTARPRTVAIPTTQNQSGAQISRINYGRPETWTFFFAATIGSVPASASAANSIIIQVLFDVIIGVGRSQFSMVNFAGFNFQGNEASLAGRSIWTAATRAPETNEPGPSFRPDITTFPAQDIQCNARVSAIQGGGGAAVGLLWSVQLEAFFAPRTHVRPEWLELAPRFPGGENKGM